MAAVFGLGNFVSDPRDRAFGRAILISLLLHGLLLVGTGFLKKPPLEMASPGPIVARLVPPRAETSMASPEEPAPPVEPTPPPPPPPPVPQKSSPVPAPAAPKAPPLATPSQQPSPAPSVAAPFQPSSAPAPSAPPAAAPVEPIARADPQPPARSSPPPPAPNSPSQEDAGTIERYRLDVMKAAVRYTTRPNVPGMRDEATAVVRMVIGNNGLIASISVQRSAGYEVLDRNAVDTLRKAKPLVPIPTALRGKEFPIDVPFYYQVTN